MDDLNDPVATQRWKYEWDTYMGLSQQLYDMGMPVTDLQNVDRIHEMVAKAEVDFNFVMITEKFEESIILLADLLCWPLEYITGFKKNARTNTAQVSKGHFSYIQTCSKDSDYRTITNTNM